MFKKANNFSRVIAIICTVVLLTAALWVPISFSASADSQTAFFGFEDAIADGEKNKQEATDNGVGYWGWGFSPAANPDGGKYINATYDSTTQWWTKVGGYRFNNADGVYNLEPATSYVVAMKLRVKSGPVTIEGSNSSAVATVSLGYGASFNPNSSGNATNYVNTMSKTITQVLSCRFDSSTYTLVTAEGDITVPYSEDWRTVSYAFTTPGDMGAGDKALAVWTGMYAGFSCQIDDVTVVKLGETDGAVVAVDDYSGEYDLLVGEIGAEATMPEIKDRARQNNHSFIGWGDGEKIAFAKEAQVINSKWDAPVTYTFKDTLNGKDYVVNGQAKEEYTIPADPDDSTKAKWFMGWYTADTYTELFENSVFGYEDKTLYSRWEAEIPTLSQDFENYTKEQYEVKVDGNGYNYKSNNLWFSMMMEKQSEVTYNNSGYAVKFAWDKTMTKQKDNPSSYAAAERFDDMDMYFWLGKGLDNNQKYVVTFKYYIESADTDVKFYVTSAMDTNIWANYTKSANYTVSKDNAGKGWQEGKFEFTTAYKAENRDTMFLGVLLAANENVLLYVDDVEIKPETQPYEAMLTVVPNNGEQDITIVGRRGEKLELPTLTGKNGTKFLGWYADEALTVPFEETVYQRKPLTVYAKWSVGPLTFEDYPYYSKPDNCGFGTQLSLDGSGVGIDDDWALHLNFRADNVYKVTEDGTTLYMNTRYNEKDHLAIVGSKLQQGELYRLTYSYKVVDANTSIKVTPYTIGYNNIWAGDHRTQYSNSALLIDETKTDWVEYTTYFVADLKGLANSLALSFTFQSDDMSLYADVLVDNVYLEKIDPPYVLFDAMDGRQRIVSGKVGETIEYPTFESLTGAKFLGWYADELCTVPFTQTKFTEECTVAYARWSASPLTFKNYPYYKTPDNCGFGKELSLDGSGVGIDDNWALRVNFAGNHVYKVADGKTIYMNTRFNQKDHLAIVAKNIIHGAVYKLTYNYKVVDANTVIKVTPMTGHSNNIWVSDQCNVYSGASSVISEAKSDWKQNTVYFSADIKNGGNTLYLSFTFGSSELSAKANLLVDNVLVERIDPPYVFFEPNNGEPATLISGETGKELVYPENPTKFGHTFKGWYTDAECTKKFNVKTLEEGMEITVYAGYNQSSVVKYTFENYGLKPNKEAPGKFHMEDVVIATASKATSGSKVARFDRTGTINPGASAVAIANGDQIFETVAGTQYVVSVNYRITKKMDSSVTFCITAAHKDNMWANTTTPSGKISVPVSAELNVWKTINFVIDPTVIKENARALYLRVTGGVGGIIEFDDVVVTTIPKGYGAVVIENGGCMTLPSVLTGKIGSSYSHKLPETAKREGFYFKGYFTKDDAGTYNELIHEDMKFGELPTTVYARFFEYEVKQDFEGDFVEATSQYLGYTVYDFDYELYDAEKEGNSKDNVTSGRYSLHRKGNSRFFENSILLTLGNNIAEGERYTVTMKVKLGNHLHTDGAIKVASGRSYLYSWHTTGDYYAVTTLADIADGQWHEVSYTFNSVEGFVSIQTPGYAEIFIDDVVFKLVDKNTALSTPPVYTEYVPSIRDEQGNVIEQGNFVIDVDSIIDASLEKGGLGFMPIAIIGGGVILLAAVVVLVIILIKRKKKTA